MPSFDLNRTIRRVQPDLADLLIRLSAAIEGDAWAVGGFVRDLVIGRRPLDLDLALRAGAREAAESLALAFAGSPFALDEERETYRVVLGAATPIRTVDLSILRGEGIEGDLADRDFTVNAMAARIGPTGLGALIDPFDGRGDARSRLVRMVSEEALESDPLRLLRAARIATELDFEIEEQTAGAIKSRAPLVLQAAAERQRDELTRMIAAPRAARGMRLLDDLGLLEVLLPELTRARGVGQPESYHHFDVFDHCIEALAITDWLLSDVEPPGRMPRSLRAAFWEAFRDYGLDAYFEGTTGGQTRLRLTKFATLLHDVSKPETKSADADGRIRFLGHSEAGARVAGEICSRLRFGSKERGFVARLVEEHLRPAQLSQTGLPTDRAIFRFFRALGNVAPACLVLSLADAAAALGPRLTLSRWRAHLAYIAYVFQRGRQQSAVLGEVAGSTGSGPLDWAQGRRHFVSGDTLIRALGLKPGPQIGRLLLAIDEAAGSGELHTEEEAIQLAKELWASDTARRAGVA